MKMARTLIILLGCVALAVAAVLILPSFKPEGAEETAVPTTPPEELLLSDKKSRGRIRITIKSGDREMVILL
jgi:hypothetical protein